MFAINHTPAGLSPYVNKMRNASVQKMDFLEEMQRAEGNAGLSRQSSLRSLPLKEWELDAVKQGDNAEQAKTEVESSKLEQSQTDTDIVVKADGSRVLVITTSFGGMQTTMSLEISKPTAMQNDVQERSSHEPGDICGLYDRNQLYQSENTEYTQQPADGGGILCGQGS